MSMAVLLTDEAGVVLEHEAKPVAGLIKIPLPFETRFHYRNVAAAHAKEAAALLPPKTARRCEMLGTAGRWLKDRHEDQARKIYKEAVATCFRAKSPKWLEAATWWSEWGRGTLRSSRRG